jgi:hypothetical protein
MHRPYFAPKGDNRFIGHKLALNSWNNLSGLHTCLVVADLAGITAARCSIDPCFHIRCNPTSAVSISIHDRPFDLL